MKICRSISSFRTCIIFFGSSFPTPRPHRRCSYAPRARLSPALLIRSQLVGHSMGGAVVVNTVPRLLEAKYRVSGVTVLDVVEGTAIDALPHMPSILNSRPEGFDSVSDAIEWQYAIPLPSLHSSC